MKSVIMSIVAMASLTATAATYVTVQECNYGEANNCHSVTYKVRSGSMVAPAVAPAGATSEGYVQTPSVTGVPAWLQSLNKHFSDKGLVAPSFPGYEAP